MIVIPMAGLSRRFTEAGFERPKYMLDLHGRSLFAHSVESFRSSYETESFLFIARAETGTEDFIAAELARMGVASHATVILAEPTRGQAQTVRLGLLAARTPGDEPLTIFNIDTFRPGFTLPKRDWFNAADGYLEVMEASDPGYSYVLPSGQGDERVAATAEKEVISNLASTGLYWFRRASDFLAITEAEDAGLARGELYVAPLYNELIARGGDVRYHQVPAKDVVFCGTPSQYAGLMGEAEARATPLERGS